MTQPLLQPAGQEPTATAPAREVERSDFLWKTHSYISDYIRFADTKASVMIAITTALLGGLLTSRAHHLCSPRKIDVLNPEWQATWLGGTALFAFAFLVLAFCCAVIGLSPRLWGYEVRGHPTKGLWDTLKHFAYPRTVPAAPQPGFIFWGEILKHDSPEKYWSDLRAQQQDNLDEAVAKHLFVLAEIADAKYFFINRSMLFAMAGSVLAGLLILGST